MKPIRKVYYFRVDIRNVTSTYYDIILSALRKNNVDVESIDRCTYFTGRYIDKSDYILVTSVQTFLKLYVWGHRNFIYWFQGITPEESQMAGGTKFDYYLFSFIEKLALKTTKYRIGVSKYLFEHYTKKYGLSIPLDSVFIMPCFNSEFHESSFRVESKYSKNTFCFAGGMQPWQGFEKIVALFKEIEDNFSDAYMKVYSKDKDTARIILEKYSIKNYLLDYVPAEEMEKVLKDSKFGFILRDDNIVNNVATPTKLGTYIGNGIIPIFTPTIKAFADLSKSYKYLCCIDTNNPMEYIRPFMQNDIPIDSLLTEYKTLFAEYFDREMYINRLSHFFDSYAV